MGLPSGTHLTHLRRLGHWDRWVRACARNECGGTTLAIGRRVVSRLERERHHGDQHSADPKAGREETACLG